MGVSRCCLVLGALLPAFAVAANGLARTPDELIARMDFNGDRLVDVGEYQAYLSRGFRAMDRNGNDIVDLHELPSHVVDTRSRPIPLARHRDNLTAAFHAQDRNGDGQLDAVELQAPPPR